MISDLIKNKKEKKGQVTIFIIVAIVIIVGIALYFILRGNLFQPSVPKDLEPVYSYYLSCVQGETENAVSILGSQGGYIEQPVFERGSEYMPFSNQLSFLGIGVPYWYYVSGNGIKKEQVPSKAKMQEQLNDYLKERLNECDFSQFEEQGILVDFGEASVDSTINDNSISVSVKQDLSITNGEVTWSGNSHSVYVNSNLGKFYNLAKKIYSSNKEKMFLENYGVDVLRLYAPVDGSDIGCSPKIWMVDNIRKDLIVALENNIPAIKLKGNYYTNADKYFVQNIGENVDVGVNFMYVKDWPMKMEVWPSEDEMLRADPVGLQEGLGMLGFCYTPYHFVYDFAFPVMIQLYSGSEIFQFPVVVSIDKNVPRQALDVEGLPDVVPELCEHKNTKITVYTYDTSLEYIPAEIKFKCFDTQCSIGRTESNGSGTGLVADFPQCENGFIIASAEGYKTKKYQISSINEGSADIVLSKKYKLELEVEKSGTGLSADYAVVTFTKDDEVQTVAYPEMKEIELTEGQYEVKVYVYSNSTINLKGSSTEKCVDVPQTGLLGMFGMTKEKCFTINIPDQVISFAVSGGGKQQYYTAESELQNSRKLIINANNFGIPAKVEDLQNNYNSVEVNGLDIRFE
ncbi:MAG: hypothetical protein PHH54_04470 [Candidatus Nanoarchaeia archaeon]|nr:hypothetical protein [Candidatus Nanoarchaeia archaeon]MDD5741214.1 hypothetical protein [Candidatus Nanoarchaeia archaeon]